MSTRQRNYIIAGVVVGLAVALLASFVWPSSPSGSADEARPAPVDATGPVGRIGIIVITGRNTGGATEALVELPGAGPGDYTERPGTASITGPIGGLEAALGAPATPGALGTAAAGAGGARGTPGPASGSGR
jgi:hypothetical protein